MAHCEAVTRRRRWAKKEARRLLRLSMRRLVIAEAIKAGPGAILGVTGYKTERDARLVIMAFRNLPRSMLLVTR